MPKLIWRGDAKLSVLVDNIQLFSYSTDYIKFGVHVVHAYQDEILRICGCIIYLCDAVIIGLTSLEEQLVYQGLSISMRSCALNSP